MVLKGDVVRFKTDWQDEGDENIVFVALEDEDGGRVLIQAQLGLELNPTQVAHTYMLEDQER